MSDKSSESRARERLHESLSAVLDGQASEMELRRVLDSTHSDEDVRAKAMRYQRISDSIRRENNQFSSIDLTASISTAIASEANYGTQSTGAEKGGVHALISSFKRVGNWNDTFGKVAVAASVFFAVVLGTLTYITPQDNMALVADAGFSPSPTTLVQPVQVNQNGYAATGIRAGYHSQKTEDNISPEQIAYAQSVADRATRERFRAYALQHAELSVMSTGQGVLPFARLTSFDVQ